ncbi:MAG: endolytic transglycosylase MltG [Gorillibacterium sp.]|nr:endolytic transglycosylase MltG [Gorillibacterium sp.]
MAKQKKSHLGLKIFLSFFLVMIIAVVIGVYYVWSNLQPAAKSSPVTFEILSGTGSIGVADILEQKGIIRNKELFTFYLRYKNEGTRFQAGNYEMSPGITLDEIIAKLNHGEIVKEEMVRFTIPEGFTLKQIIARLDEEGIASADELLHLTEEPDKLELSLPVDALPTDPKLEFQMEGYLFPETYEMKKGSTSKEIVQRMANEMMFKLESVTGWQDMLKKRGLTLHELMTVASLVEREAAVDKERSLIAGVIYNRLENDMRLEIDATVQYALGENKERLYEKDLQIDSPYNTYKNDGLPPGPIGSPGLDSIKAALKPVKTEYLFYVTKKDGSREHLFAKTYAEHLKNIDESKKTVSE